MTESPIALDSLQRVSVEFSGTLYLYQDTFQFASVAGREAAINNMNRTIENGTWKVFFTGCLTCEDETEVVLVVPKIQQVELVGSGKIIAEQSFRQNEISIVNKGSGTIEFKQLSVDSLHLSSEGNGKIKLSGEEARVIQVSSTGSGDVEMYQLPGLNILAQLSGSGNIYTTAINTLDVNISSSGNLYYQGAPEITQEISGSGNVIKN